MIGNPPLVLGVHRGGGGGGGTPGRWVLPYWREHPRASAEGTCRVRRGADYSGVLVSSDGVHWVTHGAIEPPNKAKGPKPDWLIEGSVGMRNRLL